MKIIIIGGSIAGLSAGIALHCKGYDVEIFERSASDLKDRGAGLVVQPDMMTYLNKHHISASEVFGVPAFERQVLDKSGQVVLRYQNDTSFTSWSYVWNQLREYFPKERYHLGYNLKDLVSENSGVTANFWNGETRQADLLIGGDGYNSVVRNYIAPEYQPRYAGYIAYRGLIPESSLDENIISFLENKFSIFPYRNSHLLSYMVPGPNGELDSGKRLCNWVWYVNRSQAELDEVLTDVTGKKRAFSVPPGFLSTKTTADLYERALHELPALLQALVFKTPDPFIQVIEDLRVPKMFYRRLAILGDAAFVVRPHTASGTAKAYRDAIALADCLFHHNNDIDKTLAHWSNQQVTAANQLADHGLQLAARSGLGLG